MNFKIIGCFLLLLFCACASTQQVIEEEKNIKEENRYLVYYSDKTGFHTLDTKTNLRSTLLSFNGEFLQKKISAGNNIAVSYIDNNYSCLSIINTVSSNVLKVKAVPSIYSFSFDWSPDGQYLGYGYATKDDKRREDNGGIFFVSYDGKEKKNVGCRVSNEFISWLPGSSIMAEYKNTFFIVDRLNCKTQHTIPGADMMEVIFAPDKTKFLFSKIELDFSEDKNGREIFALYNSDYKGKDIKKLISYKYDPRNAAWSPDGEQVVCDIASQEFKGIRHIALYNITDNKVNFFQGDIFYDTEPNCIYPCWSPDGKKLLYHRSYKKENKLYEHIVIKNLLPEKNRIVADCETDINGQYKTTFIPSSLEWIKDDIVLFKTRGWAKIYSLKDNSAYTLQNGENPLFIKLLSSPVTPSASIN